MRKTYTQQQRELILEKLEQSGMSRMQFCRTEGLCYQTVLSWQKKVREESIARQEGFVEVRLPGMLSSSPRACVRLCGGAEVWFEQVGPAELARFCRELGLC